jgi:hypothetical protein
MKLKQSIVGLALVVLVIGTANAESLTGKTVYITGKTVKIKSSTGFFAGTTGTLVYGDQVKVLNEKGTWVEISGKVNGWTASSNVTTKKIASNSGTNASADEIALAGKGFSEEVEDTYKADPDKKLNYKDIDEVEKIIVSDEEVQTFIIDGDLAQGGE